MLAYMLQMRAKRAENFGIFNLKWSNTLQIGNNSCEARDKLPFLNENGQHGG
jgi:hypothetical protein